MPSWSLADLAAFVKELGGWGLLILVAIVTVTLWARGTLRSGLEVSDLKVQLAAERQRTANERERGDRAMELMENGQRVQERAMDMLERQMLDIAAPRPRRRT